MVRSNPTASGRTLVAELPTGSVAYVDADWLPPPEASDSVPALVVRAGMISRTWDAREATAPSGDPDTTAASALLAVADTAAAAALEAEDAGGVDVVGDGFVAAAVRVVVAEAGAVVGKPDRRPGAIVVTNARAVASSLGRVADGGVVIVAGIPPGADLSLSFYGDVHVRGLELLGVAPPLENGPNGVSLRPGGFTAPPSICSGDVVPPATWYRIETRS